MELLIIKTQDNYLRTSSEPFKVVTMDKASVFPMDQLDRVREMERRAEAQGFRNLCIKKLVLSEEDLS